MDGASLTELARELLAAAADSHSGRESRTIHGGREHALRQTVIGIVAGQEMQEHESPGEATLMVLDGKVRLLAGPDVAELGTGDFVVIPPVRHSLEAIDDSVVLLTTSLKGH